MINSLRFFSFFVLLVFAIVTSNSQITITKADVDAGFLNVKRMNINVNYNPHPSVNLGNATGSAQTFNFASIAGTDTSRDTTISSYVSPTGLPGADQFPSANMATSIDQPPPFPGATLSITQYFSSENDGFYIMGVAIRYVVPGFTDTLIIYRYSPKALQAPLPLTLGTQRTTVDTFYTGTNNYEVATRTFDANGFGAVTLPNGTSAQAIRVINDRVELEYSDGSLSGRNHDREVFFITENSDYLSFDANDTNYTSGTTSVSGYDMSIKGGAVDVRQIISGIPDQFSLAQNFPNPFNPTTTISFQVTKSEFVSLKIFDVLGREIKTLVNSVLNPGTYDVEWDAADASGGVYYYKLSTPSFSEIKKMVLAK